MAVPFDSQRLAVTGTEVPVVEGILQSTTTGVAQYSISATGSLVYIPGGVQATQYRLVWVDRKGAEQPVAAPARAYVFPRLSPDGRRLAVTIQGQEVQLWLYDLSRETLTRFAFDGKFNTNPVWTPDGKRIAFNSNKEGPVNLFWQLAEVSASVSSSGISPSACSITLHRRPSWCAGRADFAGVCRNLPSYLVEVA